MSGAARLDHLVVMASSLAEGVAWCEGTLGVTPDAGGEHALFGTHNRLLNISSSAFPRAYLEVIAINPTATPTRAAGMKRWFDMDNPQLRAQIAQHGPQLIHWVAEVADLRATHAAWQQPLGLDRGAILQASRPTPTGLLEWQICVRDDGQRLFDGCLPTLIQWGEQHPANTLPQRGVQLQSLELQHADAALLSDALNSAHLPLEHIHISAHHPTLLRATLATPGGIVTLEHQPVTAP